MNIIDKNPCVSGTFSERFFSSSLVRELPWSWRGAGRGGVGSGKCVIWLGHSNPSLSYPAAAWLSPPDCGPAWALGGAASRPDALFTLGLSVRRGRCPPGAVISHRFLPCRCGSAFLRLEQQLSLRRRLGRGQEGPLALGPSRGAAWVASMSLLLGCGLGLRFHQQQRRRGARSRAQRSR